MSRRRARLSAALTCARVSLAARAGSGALASSSSASGASRSSKASSAAGKYSRSWCRSRCTCAGPFPDQRLVRPGHHLDRPRPPGCRRPPARSWWESVRTMSASMCASPRVALGAGHAVPFPVPGRLQRVHREHRVPGRDQRRHPRAAVGLDPDHHLRVLGVLAQVLRRSARAAGPSRPRPRAAAASASTLPGLVHHLHVVMVLGPVITHEQPHQLSRPQMPNPVSSQRENHQRPNETVLTPHRRARHPSSDQLSRPPAGARSFAQDSRPRRQRVLTCRRPPATRAPCLQPLLVMCWMKEQTCRHGPAAGVPASGNWPLGMRLTIRQASQRAEARDSPVDSQRALRSPVRMTDASSATAHHM